MILYFLWIDGSRHGLFCYNCNTLTSPYFMVGMHVSIPRSLPCHWVQLITPGQCGKLLWGISIDWLWPGYDQQFGFCYLCRPTANIRDNRSDDTSISVCNVQSNCVRARNKGFWSSNLECVLMNCWQISCRPSSSELLGYSALHSRFSTLANKSATSR